MNTKVLPIKVRKLSESLGALISGVDLKGELDDDTVAAIRQAWLDHIVLVFPGQQLSEADQERFGRTLGELQEVRTGQAIGEGHPAMMLITNVRDTGAPTVLEEGDMQYHYDQCYYEYPSEATILYAMEVPAIGGNTLFANCYDAYETLADDIKRRIDGRMALNVYDYAANPTHRGADINWDAPHWVHPVVRTHPENGRKALYISRLMTFRIEDMDADESDELLAYLFDHMERPEFVYEHKWRIDDLLVWDNRCSVHARAYFDPAHRRMMRRLTTKGATPVV